MGAMTVLSNPMLATIGQTGTTSSKVRAHADVAGTGSGTSTSSKAATSSTDSLGTTFLSLLVQELQNQDPTAPMDSTQMVGQMISLNQLNQLTSINQTLTTAYGTTTGTSGTTSGSSTSGAGTKAIIQVTPDSQTAAALRLLQGGTVSTRAQVSPSVTLPAL